MTSDARGGCATGVSVLHVDYSIGFGGAAKSLSLRLGAAAPRGNVLLTSQDPAILSAWFGACDVHHFRRLVNYRTKARAEAAARGRASRWATTRALALADLAATYWNARRISALIRRDRPALLHLNNGFTPPEAMRAARATGIPCVVHLRDFQHVPAEVTPAVARATSRVIAVSGAVGRSLERTPIPPDSIVVIHDPVDLRAIASAASARARIRASLSIPETAIAVGIFGRIIPWKGIREFVLAAAEAMRQDARIRAVIVGDESDGGHAYVAEVHRTIAGSGVAERFVLAGYRSNVEELYWAMDVVVHASIIPEPFGMVVPEAMAAGRAVIAADAGGPREVITRGVDGLLVAPGEVRALGEAIVQLAGDESLRTRLGGAARETARRFGLGEHAAKVDEVYEDILRERIACARS